MFLRDKKHPMIQFNFLVNRKRESLIPAAQTLLLCSFLYLVDLLLFCVILPMHNPLVFFKEIFFSLTKLLFK